MPINFAAAAAAKSLRNYRRCQRWFNYRNGKFQLKRSADPSPLLPTDPHPPSSTFIFETCRFSMPFSIWLAIKGIEWKGTKKRRTTWTTWGIRNRLVLHRARKRKREAIGAKIYYEIPLLYSPAGQLDTHTHWHTYQHTQWKRLKKENWQNEFKEDTLPEQSKLRTELCLLLSPSPLYLPPFAA